MDKHFNISYVRVENNTQGYLAIFDLYGRKIYSRILAETFLNVGIHDMSFVPNELSSGVYVIALHFDNTFIAEKFTYLK